MKRLRLSKGQIAVVITVALPVLVGVMGLGIDCALLYFNWVQLQKAADAAALAGAEQLTGDPATTSNSSVTACAQLYACQDGISVAPDGSCPYNTETCGRAGGDTMTVNPASDAKSVTVTAQRTVPYIFLRVLGLTTGGVAVHATAGILPTTGACQAAPFGLPCRANCNGNGCYGQGALPGKGDRTCGGAYLFANENGNNAATQIQLKSDWSITGVPGNWDPLAIGGSGSSVYRTNIAHGEKQTITPGQRLSTETGNIVGPTAQGFSDRGLTLTSTPVDVPSQLSPDDPHIMVVPLVDYTQDPKNGKGTVPVLDFITLYIQALVGNNTIVATVIPPVAGCGIPTTTAGGIVGAPFKAILCPDSGCPTLPGSEWPST